MLDQPPAIIIQDDRGGSLGDYLRKIIQYQTIKALVRVDGDCLSACTMYLGLPKNQICITPNARFGFHHASIQSTDGVLLANYPPVIRNWIEHSGGLTYELKYLGYRELKKLYPTCSAT